MFLDDMITSIAFLNSVSHDVLYSIHHSPIVRVSSAKLVCRVPAEYINIPKSSLVEVREKCGNGHASVISSNARVVRIFAVNK